MEPSPTQEKIVFLVTSVLQPVRKPLCYTGIRSRFTPLQRLEQLKETIESIRKHFPNKQQTHIILLEGSPSLSPTILEQLSLLEVQETVFAPSSFVDSMYKCQGEAFLIQKGLEIIRIKYPFTTHLFKLSGRYQLTADFNKKLFLETRNSLFKKIPPGCVFYEKEPCVYTLFYKIHSFHFETLDSICQEILGNKLRQSIEVIFFKTFESKSIFLDSSTPLGVKGWISHSGRFVEK